MDEFKEAKEFELEFKKKYFIPSPIHSLAVDIYGAEAAFKHLVLAQSFELLENDKDYLTPELREAYGFLRNHCADFIKTFDFYEQNLLTMDEID
jgi:hypothetical protein